MLASATRIMGLAFADNHQNKLIEEQVIADIQKFYNNDLVRGDLGETDSYNSKKTRRVRGMNVTIKEVADKIAELVIANIDKHLNKPEGDKEPEPVKCKEWWINRSNEKIYHTSTAAHYYNDQDPCYITRLIEPLPYDVVSKKLYIAQLQSGKFGMSVFMDALKELGMIAEDKEES